MKKNLLKRSQPFGQPPTVGFAVVDEGTIAPFFTGFLQMAARVVSQREINNSLSEVPENEKVIRGFKKQSPISRLLKNQSPRPGFQKKLTSESNSQILKKSEYKFQLPTQEKRIP